MKNVSRNPLRKLAALVAICTMSMLLIPSAFAQGKQDFTLHNMTGVAITELYISPHSTDQWEEDILGQDTLPNGESLDITFDRKEKAAKWDLKIVDKDGDSIEWENLNLLEISEVTLHFENVRAWAEVK
jgi:hypothetical protein